MSTTSAKKRTGQEAKMVAESQSLVLTEGRRKPVEAEVLEFTESEAGMHHVHDAREGSSSTKNASSGGKEMHTSAALTIPTPQQTRGAMTVAKQAIPMRAFEVDNPLCMHLTSTTVAINHVVLAPPGYALGHAVSFEVLELIRQAVLHLPNAKLIPAGITSEKTTKCHCETVFRPLFLLMQSGHALILHAEDPREIQEIASTVARTLLHTYGGRLFIPENVLLTANNVDHGYPTCGCKAFAYNRMNEKNNRAVWVAYTELVRKTTVKVTVNTDMVDHLCGLKQILEKVDGSKRESESENIYLKDDNGRLRQAIAASMSLNDTVIGQNDGLKVALAMHVNELGARFNAPPSEAVSKVKQRFAAGEKLTPEEIPTVALELFRLNALGKIEEAGNFLQPRRTFADVETQYNTDDIGDVIAEAPPPSALSGTKESTAGTERKEDDVPEQPDAVQTLVLHEPAGGAYRSFEKLDSVREMAGAQPASGFPSARVSNSELKRKVEDVLQEPPSKIGRPDEAASDQEEVTLGGEWT